MSAARGPDAGAGNPIGVCTLFRREMMRFYKFSGYTIFAPVVTTLLYLAVFVLAVDDLRMAAGIDFARFLVPGLVMMTVIQNAFDNTSMYLVEDKMEGTVSDFLSPPLTAFEVAFVLIGSAALRGLLVGVVVFCVAAALVPATVTDWGLALFYAATGAVAFAALGLIAGIWADKWDHLEAVRIFAVVPLTFLSGTFFSIARVPEAWQTALLANPVFHLMNGFRAGVTGHAEASLQTGGAVLLALAAGLAWGAYRLLHSGYKLKA